jgi:AAA15 family ATPase/GTPase
MKNDSVKQDKPSSERQVYLGSLVESTSKNKYNNNNMMWLQKGEHLEGNQWKRKGERKG